MRLKTETLEKNQHILIVNKEKKNTVDTQHLLVQSLKEKLKKYDVEVYISPHLPKKLDLFSHIFFINFEHTFNHLKDIHHENISLIFVNKKNKALTFAKFIEQSRFKKFKVINIDNYEPTHNLIDKIFWFSFSKSNEIFLNLATNLPKVNVKLTGKSFSSVVHTFLKNNKKNLLILFFLFVFLSQVAFIPVLALSSFYFYKSALNLKSSKIQQSKKNLYLASVCLNLSGKLYLPAKPVFSFLSLVLISDNVFEINNRLKTILETGLEAYENTTQIARSFINSSKKDSSLKMRFNKVKTELDILTENTDLLSKKLPANILGIKGIKKETITLLDSLIKTKKIFTSLSSSLDKPGEKKYLLLFANNMELRPGGGFIGSFAIVRFENYSLTDFKIYDVYDADGQLKAHVEPPYAIRKYMNQPNWFLRDSAFLPDFAENYSWAKYFLKKEMAFDNFSGAALITTSAIKNILKAFDDIYLSDYKDTVNSDNFYLKTQLYAEKGFFPGSIQKKTFLGSLTKHLLINMEGISPAVLLSEAKRSLDEKQIVIFSEDSKTQALLDSLYWSGRIIKQSCISKENNCLFDYIFPVDANVGVNKANFFVNRTVNLKMEIDKSGKITNYLSLKFNNQSPNDVFPGGTYKNYFQIFLPQSSQIKKITKDDTLVEDYDESEADLKTVGFYFEVLPKTSLEIKIEYELGQELFEKRSLYQLMVQKQIGASSYDFSFELTMPQNIHLINQNFSPLVKNNQVVYNTNLSNDRIFILEFSKE